MNYPSLYLSLPLLLFLLLLPLLLLLPPTLGVTWDLSHVQKSTTFVFPGFGLPRYDRRSAFKGKVEQSGVFVDAGYMTVSEHSGTHIDAPCHFVEGGMALDEVTVDMTVASGVVIDCREEVKHNQTYQMPLQKLLDWEKTYGPIPQQAAVLVNFGWAHRFENHSAYKGSDTENLYPTISEEAAVWLLKKKDLKMLGQDTLSADSMNPKDGQEFKVHILLLGNRRMLVENLKFPDSLPVRNFRFYAVPVKYTGSTGMQVRAFAMAESVGESGSGAITPNWVLQTLVLVAGLVTILY